MRGKAEDETVSGQTGRRDRPAPTVSVILPAFDAEAYLAEALESVLAQSFTDFELLLHDDGSADATLRIAEGYAARDPRIILSHGPNRGLIATLNLLVERARGELLARMDADDICYPDRFARQVAFLRRNPEHAAVGGWTMLIDEAGREIAPGCDPVDHGAIDAMNLSGRCALVHPTVMVRRSAVLAAGLYDPGCPTAEDLDLWLRLAERGRLANLPALLLKYRKHDGSVSSRQVELQAEVTRKVVEAAGRRRGVETVFEYRPWRMDASRASRRDHYIGYGWDAWNWGNRATWRHYAIRAVSTDPLSVPAWKLLVFGALRRPAPGSHRLGPET